MLAQASSSSSTAWFNTQSVLKTVVTAGT